MLSAGKKNGKKRSLAEELADLSNPAPAFQDDDPEQFDGFGAEASRLYSDDDEEEGGFKPPSSSAKGRLRFRSEIAFEGPDYAGKVVSRKDLLGQEEDETGETRPIKSKGTGAAGEGLSGEASSEDPDETDSEEEDEEAEDDDFEALPTRLTSVEDAEMEALDREYAQLRQEEEEVLKSVKPQADTERRKGQAVVQQRALWDRALELRICLQKPLQESCRLPHPAAREELCEANEATKRAYAQLSVSTRGALRVLLQVQEALLSQNSAIQIAHQAATNANGKRERGDESVDDEDWGAEKVPRADNESLDAMWQCMETLHSRLAPYRDVSVDRWHRKTMLASGGVAVKGRLRALSQNVSQQVASVMADPTRLIRRARAKAGAVRILGQAAEQSQENGQTDRTGNGLDGVDQGAAEAQVDVETYDDADFYQQLLREFLETSGPGALEGTSMRALRKLRNSKKKVVDRRASKGRKIRYIVHPQLVNFMAPEPMEISPVATRLFGTLFGKKTEAVAGA